jgi:hypothetical protein
VNFSHYARELEDDTTTLLNAILSKDNSINVLLKSPSCLIILLSCRVRVRRLKTEDLKILLWPAYRHDMFADRFTNPVNSHSCMSTCV